MSNYFIKFWGELITKKDNWMKLIYLHLYKDTYFIFMQAYKPLQLKLHYSKNLRKKKIYFPKLRIFTNSKIWILMESKA